MTSAAIAVNARPDWLLWNGACLHEGGARRPGWPAEWARTTAAVTTNNQPATRVSDQPISRLHRQSDALTFRRATGDSTPSALRILSRRHLGMASSSAPARPGSGTLISQLNDGEQHVESARPLLAPRLVMAASGLSGDLALSERRDLTMLRSLAACECVSSLKSSDVESVSRQRDVA
jgi:hypothetical protein